jgi:DNA-binding response OmpR family regulator
MSVATILLVEDNEDLAFGLSRSLEGEGHEVVVAGDGAIAVERAVALKPALMILDLMLPSLSGYEVLKAVRAAGLTMPVLILSARGEEMDKLHGFRLGADDYVTKPFRVSEVLARVAVHLRRSTAPGQRDGDSVYRFGNVEVRPTARTVTRGGESVALKPREYDLLLKFLEKPGVVLSRVRLLREVWTHQADVLTRTVDMHVAELRRKLEADPSSPRHFVTVWKSGYRFDP